jgi:two-component system, cell cycle sensor histidine kinase and response regulator CckA
MDRDPSPGPAGAAGVDAALAQAQARLSLHARGEALAGLGVWEWHIDEDRVWWSDQTCRLLGFEPGTVSPSFSLYQGLIHPRHRAAITAAIHGAVRGDPVDRFEHRIVRADGAERIVCGRMQVERNPDGRGVRMLGTLEDETERKSVERTARENESRLQLMLGQTPAVLWSTDRDLRITFSRGAGLAALGVANDEHVGKMLGQVLGSEDPEYLPYQAHLRALRGESVNYSMEFHDRAYETQIEPFRGDGGEIIGVIGITLDVTERRESTLALQASERHFRSLIENVQDVITVVDAEGRVLYESPAVEQVLGYPAGERVGSSVLQLVHEDDRPRVREGMERAIRNPGTRQSISLRARHREGSWRELEVVGTSLLHDPAIGGIVFNTRDVTERNLLEAQLRQAQRMESVGKLAGGIAHDFNNLLTVIQGNAQLLLADLGEDDALREGMVEIERAAQRAAELTQQLLVFSRRQVLRPRVMDLNAAVRDLEPILRPLVREDVELVLRLEETLPPVSADPAQVHQVLVNLVANASDAMPTGGRLTLATGRALLPPGSGRQGEGGVRLAVSDTGVGMTEEVRERAFDPFFTTKEPGQGTGLGLSTVYAIAEQSGGSVRLSSVPGEGTTVELFLPESAQGAPPAPIEPAPVHAELRSALILLVEDEDAVRGVARKALLRAGFEVLAVANGVDALRVVAERGHELDLVVSDVVMPHMSGPELVRRARELLPQLRVLYISGYTDEAVVRRGIVEGTAELLAKPFSPVELVRRVSALLQRAPAGT